MVGYGSTLRNNDRLDESIAIHRQAIAEYPTFAAHHAFLALALNRAGRHEEALAEALTALVDAGSENLDGYDRSLRYYRDSLAEQY
jgi:tetratricopeptide (TPR) repeat protein